ncbi:MAG: AAA family ATPase [Gammaproteobacteria bacterium]|nr:AAA family ATPase [Gammaproteobacteria bacterium]
MYLKKWLIEPVRKPLVMRGARQVGKTWVVRQLAQEGCLQLLEFNFERNPSHKDFFTENDPKKILLNIESYLGQSIDPKKSLLFLDEIQAAPELLAKLRWFYEEMPELAVIATGSLLEFVLDDHAFSMPVGRITYLHLEPLSFEEFLLARQKQKLVEYLQRYKINDVIALPIHQQLLSLFKEYIIIGGLPAAVSEWAINQSLEKINLIHQDLIATYRDDFSKYAKKIPIERLEEVLHAVPKMIGQKFVYRQVNPDIQIPAIKKALDLLCKARVCHRVNSVYANGIPLAAEINEKASKVILLDSGLLSAALGLPLYQINQTSDINLINNGGVSEQVVGQLLRTMRPPYVEPHLYYWARMEGSASSEVDYILQHHTSIIPVEVKSGSTGSLKSLHYFMSEKKSMFAVRVNSDFPTIASIDVKTNTGKAAKYTLLSIPFYLTEQIYRLIELQN